MAVRKLTTGWIATGVATAVLLAACGGSKLDSAKAAKTISMLVTSKLGVPVRSVDCPKDIKLQSGLVSTCEVTMASGEVEPFIITQSNGKFRVQPRDLVAGGVEKTITDQLAARGITASTVCPQHVVIVVGAKFTCTATDTKRATVRFTATIQDDIGSYQLKVG
ncbi:MAG: DUF4333 domain-containing protein [Solirubrobacteraceae bacterium]